MNTKRFITEFNKNKSDIEKINTFIKKHITTTYINYDKKVGICSSILNATNYREIEGVKTFVRNTPARFMLFELNLINLYTDIDIDFTNATTEFDALNEFGLIDIIIGNLPEKEYTEFSTVLQMVDDDTYENERNIVSWLDTKVQVLKLAFGDFGETITNTLNSEEFKETISKQLKE